MKILVYKEEGEQLEGSITIFMTFIFLLMFSLTGVTLDCGRLSAVQGYMEVAGYAADVAMFGRYNKELYEKYDFFAYGGYDGLTYEDWLEEYMQILEFDLQERPSRSESSFYPGRKYASVYQIGELEGNVLEVESLVREECFMKQLNAWFKNATFKELSTALKNCFSVARTGDTKQLYGKVEEAKGLETWTPPTAEEPESDSNTDRPGEESGGGADSSEDFTDTSASVEARQVENPITFLKELLQDGVLSLVCDVQKVDEGEVPARNTDGESGTAGQDGFVSQNAEIENWDQSASGFDILKGLLNREDDIWQKLQSANNGKKEKIIWYLLNHFEEYSSGAKATVPYGLEYVITGKRNQKDAFVGVVNRLFWLRTMINYTYVAGNAAFQEESLLTATEIATPMGAQALIPVIQQCILLVLSLEESCVDITALLQGRQVPVMKNQTTFKMQYAEICLANKSLFEEKAIAYSKAEGEISAKDISKGIAYKHYLWLFLQTVSWQEMFGRTLDVIQYDLRECYNQTFDLEDSVSGTKLQIVYGIPLLSGTFLVQNAKEKLDSDKQKRGYVLQSMELEYSYH